MAQPLAPASKILGEEIRARRGDRSQGAVAKEIGIPRTTLGVVERGTHTLTLATARKLAKWLGWTLDQVADAAETPADSVAA